MTKTTPIYVGKKIIGNVKGDTFYKRISSFRHFLRKPPAIAFDVQTLLDAEQVGAVNVEVNDYETGDIYRSTIEQIRREGFEMDRGYGHQIALPISIWQRYGRPVQLGLF
jgi:hypothetical protein